jgi:TPR repeat protein
LLKDRIKAEALIIQSEKTQTAPFPKGGINHLREENVAGNFLIPQNILLRLHGTRQRQMVELAHQGIAPAEIDYGKSLFWGQNFPRDPETGLKFLYSAVKKGVPQAYEQLAHIYLHSDLPQYKDVPLARETYKKGADKGHSECQNGYARMCFEGWGGPKDVPEAIKIFKLAAEGGNLSAKSNLALLYLQGNIPEVPQDIEKGLRTLTEVAAKGDFKVMGNLATIYLYGLYSVPRNYDEGVKWARQSAKYGYHYGEELLARLTLAGKGGLKKDPERAFQLFMKCAQNIVAESSQNNVGLTESQNNLGVMFAKGVGTKQDFSQAFLMKPG